VADSSERCWTAANSSDYCRTARDKTRQKPKWDKIKREKIYFGGLEGPLS